LREGRNKRKGENTEGRQEYRRQAEIRGEGKSTERR
jgi:hypothetical protein